MNLGKKTYNESAVHVVDVSLQRRLSQVSTKVEMRVRKTNLIFDHRVADIVDQTTKLFRILGIVQESLDSILLFQ